MCSWEPRAETGLSNHQKSHDLSLSQLPVIISVKQKLHKGRNVLFFPLLYSQRWHIVGLQYTLVER